MASGEWEFDDSSYPVLPTNVNWGFGKKKRKQKGGTVFTEQQLMTPVKIPLTGFKRKYEDVPKANAAAVNGETGGAPEVMSKSRKIKERKKRKLAELAAAGKVGAVKKKRERRKKKQGDEEAAAAAEGDVAAEMAEVGQEGEGEEKRKKKKKKKTKGDGSEAGDIGVKDADGVTDELGEAEGGKKKRKKKMADSAGAGLGDITMELQQASKRDGKNKNKSVPFEAPGLADTENGPSQRGLEAGGESSKSTKKKKKNKASASDAPDSADNPAKPAAPVGGEREPTLQEGPTRKKRRKTLPGLSESGQDEGTVSIGEQNAIVNLTQIGGEKTKTKAPDQANGIAVQSDTLQNGIARTGQPGSSKRKQQEAELRSAHGDLSTPGRPAPDAITPKATTPAAAQTRNLQSKKAKRSKLSTPGSAQAEASQSPVGQNKSGQQPFGQTEAGQAKPDQLKPGQTHSGQNKPRQTPNRHPKPGQSPTNQTKSHPSHGANPPTNHPTPPAPTPAPTPKVPSLLDKMHERLQGGRFRQLNEMLYTQPSSKALQTMQQEPELFEQYHRGFEAQTKQWPLQPADAAIGWLAQKPKAWKVADFGCGDGRLGRTVQQDVVSLDLVSSAPEVIACNMAHTPLETGAMDAVVFCLSLMGTDYGSFLEEAARVTNKSGWIWIAEVKSRFAEHGDKEDLAPFIAAMRKLGFGLMKQDAKNTMFVVLLFKKKGAAPPVGTIRWPPLKACVYKRR